MGIYYDNDDCVGAYSWNCKFQTIDNCVKYIVLLNPLPYYYKFPIFNNLSTWKWIGESNITPSKQLQSRSYRLKEKNYKHREALFVEEHHECGTEEAVKRALKEQKLKFAQQFEKFYNDAIGPKSESKSESFMHDGCCLCPSCL